MSLLDNGQVNLAALGELAATVERPDDNENIVESSSLVRFKNSLENNGASLDDVASHLAQQLQNPIEEKVRADAIKVILQIHGFIGVHKKNGRDSDINIVIHTDKANVQSNMFSPNRNI